MALPASGYLSDPNRTNAEMQTALEDQRDVVYTSQVKSVADLRAFEGTDDDQQASILFGSGVYARFYWDAASTEADDGIEVIKVTSVTTGRWKRITDSSGGYDISTGSTTFTNSSNNIALTGVGISVEVGDVIQVSGSASNDGEYTISVITDDNNVIVNQAHAGGTTSKSLTDETVSVTVKLLCKWYFAPIGLGQGWVAVTSDRSPGPTYTNSTNRTISVGIAVTAPDNERAGVYVAVNGIQFPLISEGTTPRASQFFTVPLSGTYTLYSVVDGVLDKWAELR